MFSQMMRLINSTDSLYLNPAQQKQLLDYTRSLPKRFKAARAVEQKEDELCRDCVARLRARFPEFDGRHEAAWDKAHRDMQLVLRYNVQGMLMDDPDIATDKLLGWLRTLLASLGMTPQFLRETFTALRDSCRQGLPADVYEWLEPHLERTVREMSESPEPAAAV